MFNDFQTIRIGDTQSLVKTITESDVRKFVEMTGDDNPLHVNRAYAESTTFKDIVVHGMLGASFISTVIGTKLPGTGALWLSQNIEFLLPVRLGDELTISCTVLKKHDRENLLELDTRILNQKQQLVLTGQGKVKLLTTALTTEKAQDVEKPRVAIVTGGAGGIGKAICLRLAKDGYHVVVNYHGHANRAAEIVEAISAGNTRAIAIQADVATEVGADKLIKAALQTFGGISVLVNNASPHINPKSLAATQWIDVQEQLDVQVKGAFNLTRACVPHMAAQRWGRIVNITSQVIDGPPAVNWTGYALAKGALAVFSNYMAAELGPKGITVNCVSPGLCATSLTGDIPEKVQLMIARQTPLRRLAKPSDVAAAVAYFVSDGADFVSGDTLAVNGGMTMR
jgi:3-oxoacyl-[acyl-carrier protein] reductase